MVWNIYGKKYNLEEYIPFHPGGSTILENTKGDKDLTALFETYHAFSNKSFYQKKLAIYELVENDLDPNTSSSEKEGFDFTNYRLLTDRIRKIFPNRRSIKAPYSWVFQNVFVALLYVRLFYAMFQNGENYSVGYASLLGQIAGMLFMSLAFNVFHDASHYAISIKPVINRGLSKLWAGLGMWNANIWFYHHVLHHHSYTGIEGQDPDLYHLHPFAAKTVSNKKALLHNKTEGLPFVMIVFPGYYLGQVISYFRTIYKKKIFRISLPDRDYYDSIDFLLVVGKIYSLYYAGTVFSFHYILGLNFWYFVNIALDHDTYENIVENHYSGKDWMKLQICHSSNFLNDNWIWTRLFGSINYQIEHHLFPNMSSVHYPTIAPIVREFCKEHDIPYIHYSSLFDAFRSYCKMIRFRNNTN